jgi:hypothetical protein
MKISSLLIINSRLNLHYLTLQHLIKKVFDHMVSSHVEIYGQCNRMCSKELCSRFVRPSKLHDNTW